MSDWTEAGSINTAYAASPYYYLSKYRSVLMGLAIIWVVWFHSRIKIDFLPVQTFNYVLLFMKRIGYGGVDVFLLLSGMGIYNSLEKNDIAKYIKNRLLRIVPFWWLYLMIRVACGRFIFGEYMTKPEILGFASFTGYWLNMSHQGNWYVYAIILFYLISPVFYSLIKTSEKKFLMTLMLMTVSLLISFSFFENDKLVIFSRVPVYIMGMYISSSLRDVEIKQKHWIGIVLVFLLGFGVRVYLYNTLEGHLWHYGLGWYPFIFIAPSMSLIIAKVADILDKRIHLLHTFLSVTGQSSLEILLISDYLFRYFKRLNLITINSKIGNSIVVTIISILTGIGCHYLIEHMIFRKAAEPSYR